MKTLATIIIFLPVAVFALSPEEQQAHDICKTHFSYENINRGGFWKSEQHYEKGFELCERVMPLIELKSANEQKVKDEEDSKKLTVLAKAIGNKPCK